MNCQRCGAPLVPGNAFCGSCGAPAQAPQPPAHPQGHGAPPPPPPPPSGYPPQQYQQPQYQQPQYQQPQYQQPGYPAQPGYGAPVGYQPVAGVGWIIAGIIFALAGGFIGIGIGGYLWGAKVDGPGGTKVKKFKGGSRTIGMIILIVGGIMTAIWQQAAGGM